jgi:hypothetical protein
LKPARPNARHRLQAREGESAISGIVRRIIYLMLCDRGAAGHLIVGTQAQ